MLFDPSSSTLYVDSSLASNLHLDDGTTVELPTDVLLNSIDKGQVQVINSEYRDNHRMDFGESSISFKKAHVVQPKYAINGPRHESIRDLLHIQSLQRQQKLDVVSARVQSGQ